MKNGLLSYYKFMRECLVGEYGYYRSGKADIRSKGDFTTSPQQTELFQIAA